MPEGPLPTLMACLNTASTLCLLAGYLFIKQKKVTLHKRAMLTAFGISACFLVTYVLHHALEGDVRFRGQGG